MVQTVFPSTIAFPSAGVIQPNGSIVVVGDTASSSIEGVLVRYRPNGKLDPTFGTGGIVTTPFDHGFAIEAVTLQHDGKIVVAGVSFDASFNNYPTIARYKAKSSPCGVLDWVR